jgi:O-antigen/teichoic acid export membrane protein
MLASSIGLVVGKLFTLGLGFLAWLVAARLFEQADVGLASGAVAAMMFCVQLALFGAGAAVITLLPRFERDPAELLDTSITIVAIVSLICAGLFLTLASSLFQELGTIGASPAYVLAFLVMTSAGTIGVLQDQISTSFHRGDQVLVRGVVTGTVTLAMLGAFSVLTDQSGALPILLAWAIGNLIPVLVGFVQLRRMTVRYRYRPRVDWTLAALTSRIGFPNWVLTLLERAPGSLLPIFVTELLSPDANAAWYAAWMMAWVVYVVPIQVGLSLFAEAARQPQELKRAVRSGILTSLAIGVVAAAGAAVIGPYLLAFLGSGYADAGTGPLRILLLAVVPFTFVQAFYSVSRARQQLKETILIGILSGIVGVGGAALVGRSYGLNGIATTWLVVQIAAGCWAAFRLHRLVWKSDSVQAIASSHARIPVVSR